MNSDLPKRVERLPIFWSRVARLRVLQRVALVALLVAGSGGCASQTREPAGASTGPAGSLCDAIFAGGKTRFLGRGYANKKDTNAGFLWVTFSPTQTAEGILLQARVRSFFGARLFRRVHFETGQCQPSPDSRFALLDLSNDQGATLQLWLWGEDNVPQHDSRLMGYLAFPQNDRHGTKIALWNR